MTDTSASTEEVTLTADHFCCTQFQKMDEQVNIIHLFVKVKLVTIHSFIEIKQIKSKGSIAVRGSAVFTDVSGLERRWPSLIDCSDGGSH